MNAEVARRAARLTARTDSLMRAAAAGDWAPLHGALDSGAPLAEFAARRQGARDANAARLGAYRGYRVLGTAPRGRTLVTTARLDHERGAAYEDYGWAGDRVVQLGMRASVAQRLHPTPDGGWTTYDLRARRGATLRADGDRLTIATADGAVTATRR
jgi:hypothetical protein